MIEKLKTLRDKYHELSKTIIDPAIIADNKQYAKLMKEYANLEPYSVKYDEYVKIEQDLESAEAMIHDSDPEIVEMAHVEIAQCKEKLQQLDEEIKIMLLPKDENDEKDVILEIRGGAGGEESCLFGAVLLRMYRMYAERNHWKFEITDLNETELGGVKEASVVIRGHNVYSKMKFEGGVHRVQRVPETESGGRIHTSTATVAVLPEQQDVEIEIDEKDIRLDTYRASGAGGQHINKTDSDIRITHFPTGIVVTCQDGRSQIQNKERAFEILKSKLYDLYKMQSDEEYAKNRRGMVGTGDRSERIRTYNYPQGRVTDHRINYTSYNLEGFLNGDLDDMIDNLQMAEQKAKLENA